MLLSMEFTDIIWSLREKKNLYSPPDQHDICNNELTKFLTQKTDHDPDPNLQTFFPMYYRIKMKEIKYIGFYFFQFFQFKV